ncbi:MAG: ribosome-associated translation inhibitor RaiA, partial [Anaerolineaceae bacterium]|nr:ribosome-associated translation inhibitor RaiA [Anaerolineaceae bacterium]
VKIEGSNIRISDELEHYTLRKLDRLDRYLPRIRLVEVDLSHEHTRRGSDRVSAQITLRHDRGAILRAEEKAEGEIRIAIDGAIDKLYRQIQRFKGKRIRRGRDRFVASAEELSLAEDIPDVSDFQFDFANAEAEQAALPIARRKDVELNPMSELEAIEQMELLDHDFFMFYNADTQIINVLYRRRKGDYGLLVPITP